ncbi:MULTISPECIES: aminodeoxychorismate synthase component I [Methylotenera]|uniref:aminodeoxychorismate synthase component I n=1 Tax=Methylotenera TaxID=359407 RepID=UPI00037C6D71|nr:MULTISPECIES: aminodeoxychorismate synthase component I [Methylotenera]
MSLLQYELAYQSDSALLFEQIAHQQWAMLLDSGQAINPSTGLAGSQYGRYDILVAEPIITLVTKNKQTTINQNGQTNTSEEDPFALLNYLLNQYKVGKNNAILSDLNPNKTAHADYPFSGGALGYFAYDLARSIEKLPNIAAPVADTPEMMVGFYDWAVIFDHREKKCILVSHGLTDTVKENWQALCTRFDVMVLQAKSSTESLFQVTSNIQSNLSKYQYFQAFNKVKSYIDAGDCYQVNLAQRFSAQVQGDSWQAYKKLREISPAPFMAYMNLPLNDSENFQVLSNSPERFLQTDGDHVETRPIKGTRPRSQDAAQDLAYAQELQNSLKDKAENVMIVDLLRNDLGKNCIIGSVKADTLFQLQSFANVHHLVSIVTGKLKPNATAVDLLKGCFPGGSITGAPKLRAMQIIEELEPHQRGLYCGAIGYIGFDGKMDTNIAIRTAVVCQNTLSFYAGGGIVADSVADKEYNETLDKASSLKAILAHFSVTSEG